MSCETVSIVPTYAYENSANILETEDSLPIESEASSGPVAGQVNRAFVLEVETP